MDISNTIEPRSDQLNADDLMAGPRTFTIERVAMGDPEQPVHVHLVETPGRPYKPSKSMRRVLVAAWGKDADLYAGRSLTLYRDPSVKFGKDAVGGIKISHLSDLDKTLTVALTVTRGKRAPHTVEPLRVAAKPSVTDEQIEAADLDGLRGLWELADDTQRARITERVAELKEATA